MPSQLSFNLIKIPGGTQFEFMSRTSRPMSTISHTDVPRRSLFDIRAQLMAEAEPVSNNYDQLVSGLEAGDLSSGIYEGGFKTWECALDLAALVHRLDVLLYRDDWHIIELGAGSAIPSMVLLQQALKGGLCEPDQHFYFTLCDYNEDVLRLVTAPNILLTGMQASTSQTFHSILGQHCNPNVSDFDVEIDADLVQSHLNEWSTLAERLAWDQRLISFSFISGTWGQDFVELVRMPFSQKRYQESRRESNCYTHQTLILASETIYSLETLGDFTQTVLDLLRRSGPRSRAWVAAKRVYFGVGGGVDTFVAEVHRRGGDVDELLDIRSEGIARVILEVRIPTGDMQ